MRRAAFALLLVGCATAPAQARYPAIDVPALEGERLVAVSGLDDAGRSRLAALLEERGVKAVGNREEAHYAVSVVKCTDTEQAATVHDTRAVAVKGVLIAEAKRESADCEGFLRELAAAVARGFEPVR